MVKRLVKPLPLVLLLLLLQLLLLLRLVRLELSLPPTSDLLVRWYGYYLGAI